MTWDETWELHIAFKITNLHSNQSSHAEWKHSSSPVRKTFKPRPNAARGFLIFFWDAQSVLFMGILEGGTINATRYCQTLSKLKKAVRSKRPGLLTSSVIFWMTTGCYMGESYVKQSYNLWLGAPGHTPYSPDLAFSDFCQFRL